MTTPELEPTHLEQLQSIRRERNRHSESLAPIDEEAKAYFDLINQESEQGEYPFEFYLNAAGFISRMVGWSSKDLDKESGQVRLASFDRTNEQDVLIDSFGRDFLIDSPNVASSEVVTETHAIQEFHFHQFRRNGKVREVTIHRKEPLPGVEATVDYCLSFNDVGQYSEEAESRLTAARAILFETISPVRIAAGEAIEKTLSAGGNVRKFGRTVIGTLLEALPESTED